MPTGLVDALAIVPIGHWAATTSPVLAPPVLVPLPPASPPPPPPQALVPRQQEREHREGGDGRPRERHDDAGHEPPVPVAVEGGRVLEVAWHLQERLAQQERAETRRHERDDQRGKRVEPAQRHD